MAWVERFTCDICNKLMGDAESWWVAVNQYEPVADDTPHPILKLMPWDNLLGHSAGIKHLCGAGCAHTFLDRWMAEFHSGVENCVGETASS